MRKSIEKLMRYQQKTVEWNFYHERQHVENLFYSRFNFFIVFYGMFLAATVSLLTDMKCMKCCSMLAYPLLSFGVIISAIMQYILGRNYQTLKTLLTLIDHLPAYHSSPMIVRCTAGTNNGYTGICIAYVVPLFCIVFLYLMQYLTFEITTIVSSFDWWCISVSLIVIVLSFLIQIGSCCKSKDCNLKSIVLKSAEACPDILQESKPSFTPLLALKLMFHQVR